MSLLRSYNQEQKSCVNVAGVIKSSLLKLLICLLCACVSQKFNTASINSDITPTRAATDSSLANQSVLWGGVIVSTNNLAEKTEIEVLSYPLHNSSQKPDIQASPEGRFIIVWSGYLEPVDYAKGRILTVSGKLAPPRKGKIDQTNYTFPVILADQLELWNQAHPTTEPKFHIGVGVGVQL